jgi:predicted nucleic acid-binding protein
VIYFDTAYIAKCYLPEPGAEKIQSLARSSDGLCSSEWGRLEFFSVLHRHVREKRLSRSNMNKIIGFFEEDEVGGVWTWLHVTPALLRTAAAQIAGMPESVFLRGGDAVHLCCAAECGMDRIYSSDRHLLGAAEFFGLQGVNVL